MNIMYSWKKGQDCALSLPFSLFMPIWMGKRVHFLRVGFFFYFLWKSLEFYLGSFRIWALGKHYDSGYILIIPIFTPVLKRYEMMFEVWLKNQESHSENWVYGWKGPNDSHFFKIVTELPFSQKFQWKKSSRVAIPFLSAKDTDDLFWIPSQRWLNLSQSSVGYCEQFPYYQVIWGKRWLMHWLWTQFLCTMLQAQSFMMTQTLALWSCSWPMSEALCSLARSHRAV